MRDIHGREIDYLRISVTDRCNLRCKYCMPEKGVEPVSHEEILTYDEIVTLAKSFAALGIRKIKITGGEPLVRKNIESLIRDLKAIPGIDEVTLTTNGTLLTDKVVSLWEAGIDGINISLDTLDPEKYSRITGKDEFYTVLDGINKCLEFNIKTKVNVVTLAGINDDEIAELAGMAYRKPIDVRFIELMPLGLGKEFGGYTEDVILEKLKAEFGEPEPINEKRGNGPAKYYHFQNFAGNVGIISAMSHSFCSTCNRIRLTATGELRTCLAYEGGIDLKELLRDGLKGQMVDLVSRYIYNKPQAHALTIGGEQDIMSKIGG